MALATPALGQSLLVGSDAPQGSTAELPHVLPVWSNNSGRVEALLLIDASNFRASTSPLGNLFGSQHSFGLRGRTQVSRNIGLNLDLQPAARPAMALLCEGNVGLAIALGRLAEPCMLAQLDGRGQLAGFGQQDTVGISLDWRSDDNSLDLSFGMSWLDTRAEPSTAVASTISAFANLEHASLAELSRFDSALGPWQLKTQELSLQGQHWLTPRSWIRVDGRHGSHRLAGLGQPVHWDNNSLSLSGGHRAFSGNITGRLIEINHPRQSWGDVDISVSWRTPWDARLSVGARNLLGGPDREKWPLSSLPGLPGLQEPEARTPYVRYQQDL